MRKATDAGSKGRRRLGHIQRAAVEGDTSLYVLALLGDQKSLAEVRREHGQPVEEVVWSALRRGERRMVALLGELRDHFGAGFEVTPDDADDAELLARLDLLGLVERRRDSWRISRAGHQLYGGHHATT